MILQGNYTDSTKELIQSFDSAMNEKNAELESVQAEAAMLGYELEDADAAIAEMRGETWT